MSTSDPVPQRRRAHIRALIDDFLSVRLSAKLDKLAVDDPKRAELESQYQRRIWLQDAAKRVQQIQLVTHTLKPIHPDARGTNLYVDPATLTERRELGSHVLREGFAEDVTGNSAALDVYKLLKLVIDGRTLLAWLREGDAEVMAALSDDQTEASAWREAFVGIMDARGEGLSSHALAKQVFWLAGDDATADDQYHLLAPLYASSLAHAVYPVIQEDRYGEANKLARQARRDGRWYEGSVRDYPHLAVQKFGGTKPQNVSQLNSERGGVNYLLSSLPPIWKATGIRMPWHMESVLGLVYSRQPEVRATVDSMLRFLGSDPKRNEATRERVSRYVDRLVDELLTLAANYRDALEPGWSRDARCRLSLAERLWLDPMRGTLAGEEVFAREWLAQDWPETIGERFARWLNAQLRSQLPDVGDSEHRNWKQELLGDESEGGWAQLLDVLKRSVNKHRSESLEGMQ